MAKRIQEEKRRYTRIIFNERNRVQAVVALPKQQNPARQMPASVLNMSEGGMQVSIERKKFQEMGQGDTVLLSRITGVQDLEALRIFRCGLFGSWITSIWNMSCWGYLFLLYLRDSVGSCVYLLQIVFLRLWRGERETRSAPDFVFYQGSC